jgi:hypothetical protein
MSGILKGSGKDSNKTNGTIRILFFLVTISDKKEMKIGLIPGHKKCTKNDLCPVEVNRLPFITMGRIRGSNLF